MAVALGMGELQIPHMHVVLEIDEGLALGLRHRPERRTAARGGLRLDRREDRRRPAQTRRSLRAVDEAGAEPRDPRRRARRGQALDLGREEGAGGRGPHRPRAALAGQRDHRVEAPRHRQRIHRNRLLATRPAQGDPCQGLAPAGPGDDSSGDQTRPTGPGRALGAGIDDGCHLHPRRLKVGGQRITCVRVGEDRRPPARRNRPAVEIGAHRAGHHHAGPVVAAENQRPLLGSGGHHRRLRRDPPQPLDRATGVWERDVLLHPLDRAEDVGVVPAEDRGSGQHPHVGQIRQLRRDPGCENGRRRIANPRGLGEQRASRPRPFVRQDHPCPRPTGRERGGEPRGACADHQQIAMRPGLVIMIRVRLLARPPEPGGAADQRLVDLFPEAPRPHEGLVVEPRPQEGRGQPVQRADVMLQGGPAVLAGGLQSVVEFLHRRTSVGLGPPATADRDQRVRLGRSGGQHAPRPVILEATPDQHPSRPQQRRGQRVPAEPRDRLSVEGEGERGGAVDLTPLGETPGGHGRTSAASTTRSTAWVAVSRVTTSQRRQPPA